jgi:hypothetical protein
MHMPRSGLRLAALPVLLAPVLLSVARADTIYLKNGKQFEGKVVLQGDQVVLVSENGSRVFFPRDRVERVERGPAPWEVYARKFASLRKDDPQAQFQLAKWCRSKRLRKRAARHLQATVRLNPDHAEARELLGQQKVGGVWVTREEALKARGYVLVDGKWLSPEEKAARDAKKKATDAAEKEKARLLELAGADKAAAKAARDYYTARGSKSLQNLMWGMLNLKPAKARLECVKLINRLKPVKKLHSIWLTKAALKEDSDQVVKEICKGIRERDDTVVMTYLVLYAAMESNHRRKAAYCLRLIHDKRAYLALIGCIAQQPKNTLPGQSGGMSLTQLGGLARSSRVARGGMSIGGGEVVPAADSMEYITGRNYRNDVQKWLKWVDSLDRSPGGAVIDKGDRK